MYALHPTSLPPKSARDKQRVHYTAEDLACLYCLEPHEYIVWDPQDPANAGLDYLDFIHLYPMYYGNYTLTHGAPAKDLPDSWTPKPSTKNLPSVSKTRRSRR